MNRILKENTDKRYQLIAPSVMQRNCPHRLLNSAGNECSTCGSRKNLKGRWEYLTEEWHQYYQTGNNRPIESNE